MFSDEHLDRKYPTLSSVGNPLKAAEREIVGREHEMLQLMASMARPELCNALMLGPAGSGKTAVVQGVMKFDPKRIYLEADPARMISEAGDADKMAAMVKTFFDEAEAFVQNEGVEMVVFIDEFHQIVMLSDASVEAIKPVLAASGARGIRIIAATTNDEFHKYIAPNQPLVQRLQRIDLSPPDEETTVKILAGMAERYGVADQFIDDQIYRLIYEYSERYQQSDAQPRKSILMLDSMCGWHATTNRPMNKDLLADVIKESTGNNIAMRVDGGSIKRKLDSKVLSQDLATTQVARRLQLVVADLHDKTKPLSSILLTGSTGVGKTELTKQLAKLIHGDDQRHLIRFDMSEYASDETFLAFRSELTKKVWDLPFSILLFDEIEKAAAMVTRTLLQVLDDGRLSDDNGRTVSFLNTYIVLTTNAGSEIYQTIGQYAADDQGSGTIMEEYTKLIRRSISETSQENRFPPELLGRIDAIVPFQPLSPNTQKKIIRTKLKAMVNEIRLKHNVDVTIHPRVLVYLAEDKVDDDSNAGGARAAVARLTTDVTTEIATFINEHPGQRQLGVEIDGELISENKHRRTSEAKVVVSAIR